MENMLCIEKVLQVQLLFCVYQTPVSEFLTGAEQIGSLQQIGSSLLYVVSPLLYHSRKTVASVYELVPALEAFKYYLWQYLLLVIIIYGVRTVSPNPGVF